MKTTRLEADGLAHWLRAKSERRTRKFFEAVAAGDPAAKDPEANDWELARKLHYKGLVHPVKPSEAWIPCLVSPTGLAVRDAMARMDAEDKKKAEEAKAAKS